MHTRSGQHERRQRAFRVLLALLAAVCFAAPARAIEQASLQLHTVAGAGWRAENVALQFKINGDGSLGVSLRATRFELPALQLNLNGIAIECTQLILTRGSAACDESTVIARGLPLDRSRLQASWSYQSAPRKGNLRITNAYLANGKADARFHFDRTGWHADLSLRGLGLGDLAQAIAAWIVLPWPDGVDGQLNARLTVSGNAELDSIRGQAQLSRVSGSNPQGTLAAENLEIETDFAASSTSDGWQARANILRSAGQVYVDPVFVDFSANPLSGELRYQQQPTRADKLEFDLTQTAIGAANGTVILARDSAALRSLNLDISEARLPGAYRTYLKPFLIGSTADRLETAGQFTAKLQLDNGELRAASAKLQGVHADDLRNRFALYDVNGDLQWRADQPLNSVLSWAGGYLYQMGVGPARLDLTTGAGRIALKAPLRIPLLDGHVAVSRFALEHEHTELRKLGFSATIEAIGLRSLTRALGWPAFSGTLSGRIPEMRYADNAITFDGALAAEVFGGQIAIEDLQIAEPFGVLPMIEANLRLRSLDLAAITSAFSFGRMEGRLDGDFERLRLLGLTPVAFDARLYTPADDRSRHRISQQAIENISDLGGVGAAAVLSRGLLSFFESFAYDRIGWRCQLADEVCFMDGVAPAPNNGYYIVRGKGLPRINVIGYSRRVSWPELLEKLKNINAENAAIRP